MTRKKGEDGKHRLVVFSFVQGVDDDDRRNTGGLQRFNHKFCELAIQRRVGKTLSDGTFTAACMTIQPVDRMRRGILRPNPSSSLSRRLPPNIL